MAVNSNYRKIIRNGIIAAAAAGPLGAIPGAWDAGAIAGIWTTMFGAIAEKSGHDLNSKFVAKFISTVGGGFCAYYAGCKIATWMFHLIPGAGTLLACGVSSLMNIVYTYKFGAACAKLLDKKEFDLGDATNAATCVLSLLCTFPIPSEIKDIISIRNSA